jgi:hypothetical protein
VGDEMHPGIEQAIPGDPSRNEAPPRASSPAPPSSAPGPSAKHMVMLTNHGAALLYLHAHPDARVRDVADALHITERATARILADLKATGHLRVTHASRRNRYEVTGLLPLHPGEAAGNTMAELVRRISSLTMPALFSAPFPF